MVLIRRQPVLLEIGLLLPQRLCQSLFDSYPGQEAFTNQKCHIFLVFLIAYLTQYLQEPQVVNLVHFHDLGLFPCLLGWISTTSLISRWVSRVCNHCSQSPIKWENFPMLIHKKIPLNSNVFLKSFVYSDNTTSLKVCCILGFTKPHVFFDFLKQGNTLFIISMIYFIDFCCSYGSFVILRNKGFWVSFFQDISF